MFDIKKAISSEIVQVLSDRSDCESESIKPHVIRSVRRDFGDFQSNLALVLGKKNSQDPFRLAQEIIDLLQNSDRTSAFTWQASSPGFLNARLKRPILEAKLSEFACSFNYGQRSPTPEADRVVIDYSGPNVAKSMHVGHLRSTIIGDCLCRVFQYLGANVIRQNHIGDWGTQFGMIIALLDQRGLRIEPSTTIEEITNYYQEANRLAKESIDFRNKSQQAVVALQNDEEKAKRVWQGIVDISLENFDQIYRRLNVLLNLDDVRGESFYAFYIGDTISDLKSKNLCQIDKGALVVPLTGFFNKEKEEISMVVQKADGASLYATTDLAALRFRIEELRANRIIYVTDNRQKQHFAMLFQVADLAGWLKKSILCQHVPFGSILDDFGRPFQTRSGQVVDLTDLLNQAVKKARVLSTEHGKNLGEKELDLVSESLAIAALKYSDLSCDRGRDYRFSWQRMLSFEGDTGPYLLNAYVRIGSLLRKGGISDQNDFTAPLHLKSDMEQLLGIELLDFPSILNEVATTLKPHLLCNYLHRLATLFHSLYEKESILYCRDQEERQSKIFLITILRTVLKNGLEILGIKTVEQM